MSNASNKSSRRTASRTGYGSRLPFWMWFHPTGIPTMYRNFILTTNTWAMLPIRFALGLIFIGHGSQKVFGAFGGGATYRGYASDLHSPRPCWSRQELPPDLYLSRSKLVFQLPTRQGASLPAIVRLRFSNFLNQHDRRRSARVWRRDYPRRWRVDRCRSSPMRGSGGRSLSPG